MSGREVAAKLSALRRSGRIRSWRLLGDDAFIGRTYAVETPHGRHRFEEAEIVAFLIGTEVGRA